jgi:DNA-binding CsgD family transcriptional regulator
LLGYDCKLLQLIFSQNQRAGEFIFGGVVLQSDENWLSVADAFNAAAVGAGSWLEALDALARATGSRAGELIGLGSEHTVPFNWVSGLGRDWLEDFIAIGGGNPEINPFVREGSRVPVLEVLASCDIVNREERRNSMFLNEHAVLHDVPHVCLTPLLKEDDMLVGMAVLRSAREGEINDEQRAVFTSLAAHVRAAVKTQIALEHQGSLLVAGALEALSLTVFVCDALGMVKAMTPVAETMASAGNPLRLKHGQLGTENPAETQALTKAINAAACGLLKPCAPLAGTVIVQGRNSTPLVLDVLPMPRREYTFGFDARALVVVRSAQCNPQRMKALLQMVYRLTEAEADVALWLAEGHSPETIAAARNTTIGTTRMQMKAIYAKLGVHRQSELVSRLGQLR